MNTRPNNLNETNQKFLSDNKKYLAITKEKRKVTGFISELLILFTLLQTPVPGSKSTEPKPLDHLGIFHFQDFLLIYL